MAAELSISLLRALTPAQVRLFAVRAGWKVESRYSGPGTLLNHPTDKLTQFRLPGQIGDPDYAHRMRDAVEKLAATQGRPATELLYELSLPPADVLHLRLQTHDGENGTLPLDLGVRLVQSGRQLLSAAACSAVRPQAYFRSLSSGPVDKFLDRCRLGQTQNGTGYSTTFAALVTPDSQTTFADHVATSDTDESVAALIADASFERKVTLILMRAMHALRAVLDGGATDGFAKTVSHGVSANLCDALTELSVSDSRAQLEVSMGWSKALRQVPARLAERVTFSQPEFSFLQAGSRELKRLDSRPVTLRDPSSD